MDSDQGGFRNQERSVAPEHHSARRNALHKQRDSVRSIHAGRVEVHTRRFTKFVAAVEAAGCD